MVIWTQRARSDLKDIHSYISEDSPATASTVITAIVEKTGVLTDLPNFGKMTPEFKDETIRETSASSWRIIYRIQDAQIYILAIVHKRRVIEGQQFIS